MFIVRPPIGAFIVYMPAEYEQEVERPTPRVVLELTVGCMMQVSEFGVF